MKKLITTAVTLLMSFCVSAEVAVIVHPSNANSLDESIVSRIYLGKVKSFPDGNQVIPISQMDGSNATEEFNEKVLRKSSSQVQAYWSKLIFTGKGTPPQKAENDANVLKLVANNPNIIGYIDVSSVDSSVKIVGKY